jgi:hypothetical protein
MLLLAWLAEEDEDDDNEWFYNQLNGSAGGPWPDNIFDLRGKWMPKEVLLRRTCCMNWAYSW